MRRLLASLCIVILVLVSCKKNNGTDTEVNTPDIPPTASSSQKPKKYQVDSTTSKFLSSEVDIASGIFKYNSLPGIDSIKKGDFFIEPRDFGYLRKVESITKNSNEIIINTTQGVLSDFYQDSGLIKRRFSIPPSQNPFGRASSAAERTAISVPTIELKLGTAPFSITTKLENFNFSFDPNFVFDMDVANKYLKAGVENAKMKMSYDLSIEGELSGEAEAKYRLSDVAASGVLNLLKRIKIPIPGAFMSVEVADLEISMKLEGGGKAEHRCSYKNESIVNAYVEYKDGALSSVGNSASPVYEFKREFSSSSGIKATLEIAPVFEIRQFEILSLVEIKPSAALEIELRSSSIYDTWDLKSEFYFALSESFKNSVFRFLLNQLEYKVKIFSVDLFKTPMKLEYVPGGNEYPDPGSTLKLPIIFQVFEEDKIGTSDPEGLVNVFFSSDLGQWTKDKARTGLDGKVQNTFTMSLVKEVHTLTAVIKNSKNEILDKKEIKITPNGPASAFIVSGNNQSSLPLNRLPIPLAVGVKDMNGKLMNGVHVDWAVTSGSGQLASATTTTNSNGQATNDWWLGASGNQTVTATIKKNDGSPVTGSPLIFSSFFASDSTAMYRASIAENSSNVSGNWICDNYFGGVFGVKQYKRFMPDGSVLLVKNEHADGTVEDFGTGRYQEGWSVVKDNTGYHLRVSGARDYYPYVLKYPVTYMLGGTSNSEYIYTRR